MPWTSWAEWRAKDMQEAVARKQAALAALHQVDGAPRSSFGIPYRERNAARLVVVEGRRAARARDRESFGAGTATLEITGIESASLKEMTDSRWRKPVLPPPPPRSRS